MHYHNIDLLLGYSKLDYLAKYENSYFGPIADITLAGLGFYIRPTYALEGSLTGSLSRPDDRKSDAVDNDDTRATFELLSLRHGPWLDAGIAW